MRIATQLSPKNVVRVFAKNRYTWSLWCQKQVHSKTKYKLHARNPAIGQPHIVPVFALKRPGTPGFVYFCLTFNFFRRTSGQSEAIHKFPYIPYTNATTFALFGLCGEHPTLATSHHHTTIRHTDRHPYSIMDGNRRQIV